MRRIRESGLRMPQFVRLWPVIKSDIWPWRTCHRHLRLSGQNWEEVTFWPVSGVKVESWWMDGGHDVVPARRSCCRRELYTPSIQHPKKRGTSAGFGIRNDRASNRWQRLNRRSSHGTTQNHYGWPSWDCTANAQQPMSPRLSIDGWN